MKSHYFWAFLEQIGTQAVMFVVSIVVARIVGPQAYGLIGMLAIFMALGQAFSELGLSAAIIQQKEVTKDDLKTLFIVNVAAGILVTGLACAVSPLVASFFKEPILAPLLCAQALTFLISSFGIVQQAIINREMKFRVNAQIEIASCITAGLVGISMAVLGFGVWSLVVSVLTRIATRVLLLWIFGSWRPSGRFSRSSFHKMWSYSSRLLYSSLAHRAVTNLYSVFIGRAYTAAALGLYTRAFSLQQIPVNMIGGVVQRVAFPLYSRNQDNPAELRRILRKQVRTVLMIVATGMGVLLAISSELILLMLGENWAGAIPLLQIFALAGVFASVFPLHSTLTMATGNSGLFLKVEMLKKLYIVVMLLALFQFGLVALAWGMVSVSVFDYVLSSWPSRNTIAYRLRQHLEDLLPTLAVCAVSTSCALLLPWPSAWHPLLIIGGKAAIICGSTITAAFLLRRSYFQEVWDIAENLIRPRLTFLRPRRA